MRSGKAWSSTIIVPLSFVLTLIWACPGAASITAIGDIDPAYDYSDPWILSTDIMVGHTADASLVISGGSQILPFNPLTGVGVSLAYDPGVTASLTVTGPGSLLDGGVGVGFLGNATLLIADGGVVTNGGILAEGPGSTALATITGAGSLWENPIDLQIGRGGDATLVVANGGMLTSAIGYVGFDPNSTGHVTVTGAGSAWENRGSLTIGRSGDGTVVVADGGMLTSEGAYLGFNAGSVGRVTVTGPNSVWENLHGVEGGDINIGWFGDGSVTVADGARVTTIETGTELALWQPGAMGTLTVTGPNSLWETEVVTIGGLGNATVNILDGGTLVSGDAVFSAGNYGSTATINVSGPGSLLEVYDYLGVALEGRADMVISNGGRVHSVWSRVAEEELGIGTVTVTGPNSVWDMRDSLILGDYGDANMVVADGGTVTDRDAFLAQNATSTAQATVTGAGSTWDNRVELEVGIAGRGTVTVTEGGCLTSLMGVLGVESTGYGVVEVIGPNSVWELPSHSHMGVAGALYVGQSGYGRLVIGEGGRVTTRAGARIGSALSGGGDVQVTGAGSVWDNRGDLRVGVAGWGHLYVEDGAHVTSRAGVLGVEATGSGSVIVDSPGSLWEILPDPNTGSGGDLTVGQAGHGHLQIGSVSESGVGGGTVTAKNAVVGALPGSDGRIPVIGEGSKLEIEEGLVIGAGGDAHVGVSEGGQVIAFDTRMATATTGTVTARVDGLNSVWETENFFIVGDAGEARLDILEGGRVASFVGMVGYDPGSLGSVYVDGPNSVWENASLTVGVSGLADVVVTNGGRLTSDAGVIGLDPNSGGEVRIMDPNSVWENTGILTVGSSGYGILRVVDGGRLINGGVTSLGEETGSWAAAIVDGPNSVWTNAGPVYVGGNSEGPGGTATLSIFNEGLVEANDVTIWSTGSLRGDGTLRANEVLNYGTIQPGASIGTLTIDGNLDMEPNGTLEMEIDNNGNGDRILVTGTFAMGAASVIKPVPTQTIIGQHQYTVVEANDVVWPVITIVWGDIHTPFLNSIPRLGVPEDPNSVILYVEQVPFDDPSVARTDNQRSLGVALERIAEQDPNNEITTTLQQLQTDEQAQRALNQLSGQTIPALAPVSVADTTKYMSMVSNRLRNSISVFSDSVGLPLSPAGAGPEGMAGVDRLGVDAGRYGFAAGNGTPYLTDKPWAVWGRGYGLFGDRESEGGVPGYEYQIYGGSFGFDYQLTERLLLGITGGYSNGDINHSSSRDREDITTTHGGLYGRYETPRWYVDAIGTYAGLDYETRRFVDALGEQLEGDPSGSLFSGYFEVGSYHWLSKRTVIQPLAAFQLAALHLDSFTESGGTAALHFDDQDYESYRGSLGLKVTQELFRHDDGCRASAELRGRWVHEFGDTQASLDAEFLSSPGVVFRVSDAEIARDSAVLGAGLDTWFSQSLRLFLDYATELNADNTIQLVSAGLEYRW